MKDFNQLPLNERQNPNNWPRSEDGKINLRGADFCEADLRRADFTNANLIGAQFIGAMLGNATLNEADLTNAEFSEADLLGADLRYANLAYASFYNANLYYTNFYKANLFNASLRYANLRSACLHGAKLTGADLLGAILIEADFGEAYLEKAKGLTKLMGVIPGNYYYKRIGRSFKNEGYYYRIGLNELKEGAVFAADERITCSFPGLYFSSKSWADVRYGMREFLAKIRVPEDAQINEPWASDGKASADKIEIVQVWMDGLDVTDKLRNIKTNGRGELL